MFAQSAQNNCLWKPFRLLGWHGKLDQRKKFWSRWTFCDKKIQIEKKNFVLQKIFFSWKVDHSWSNFPCHPSRALKPLKCFSSVTLVAYTFSFACVTTTSVQTYIFVHATTVTCIFSWTNLNEHTWKKQQQFTHKKVWSKSAFL